MNVTMEFKKGERVTTTLSTAQVKMLKSKWTEVADWQAEELVGKQWKMVMRGLVNKGFFRANAKEDFFHLTKQGGLMRAELINRG